MASEKRKSALGVKMKGGENNGIMAAGVMARNSWHG
jgi:hypothetical protein